MPILSSDTSRPPWFTAQAKRRPSRNEKAEVRRRLNIVLGLADLPKRSVWQRIVNLSTNVRGLLYAVPTIGVGVVGVVSCYNKDFFTLSILGAALGPCGELTWTQEREIEHNRYFGSIEPEHDVRNTLRAIVDEEFRAVEQFGFIEAGTLRKVDGVADHVAAVRKHYLQACYNTDKAMQDLPRDIEKRHVSPEHIILCDPEDPQEEVEKIVDAIKRLELAMNGFQGELPSYELENIADAPETLPDYHQRLWEHYCMFVVYASNQARLRNTKDYLDPGL